MSVVALHSRPAPVANLAGALDPAAVVVLKFGSSVLTSPADAPAVASEIYAHVRAGRRVVAVVSALAGETDRLLSEARALGLAHDNDLLPAYVALGEERAAALVAIACDRVGLDARALSVRELGLLAAGPSEHAHPLALVGDGLKAALVAHQVVVAPGFGAVRADGRVALLGRGGSDLTAAFLAAELGLDRVRLVKDVDGLYDHDPARGAARRFAYASWDEACRLGGRLVQTDAIDLGRQRGVQIEIAALGRADHTLIGDRSEAPAPARPQKRLRVAVAGCGVVGGGALRRLLPDPRFEVVGVLVRNPLKPRDIDCPAHLFVTDPADLLDRRPEVLLEALSDGEAGYALVRAALERGVDVASANKQAVARDPGGLLVLAADKGARVLWSASVGGGAPMVETIRAARAAGPVVAFEAVLNGTVNFMLERLGQGAAFDQALHEARLAGFAEEDPSADLEGHDAAAKVKLLAYEAFGAAPSEIARDVLSAEAAPTGDARPVASCRAEETGLSAAVRLDAEGVDPLFLSLRGEGNALKVIGQDGRVWTCRGRGAGRWATAESLLADLNDLMRARAEARI